MKGDLNLNGGCTRLNLVSSESGGTSADSLDRSPGSLETSGGPECGYARFGAAHKPGQIIVHPALSLNPAFTTSKNLPACLRAIKGSLSGLRFPFTPRALSGWYVPSPDLPRKGLNGRNAEYSALLGSRLTRPVLKPDREEKGLGLNFN